MSLSNLANRLSELGRREEALTVAEEAVALYRRLALAAPQAFVPDQAMSLSNLANRLSELGRREEALTVAEEAVALYRRLALAAPQAFVPDQARSLNNLASFLSELGRREEALAAAEEAVGLYRQLADAANQAFVPNLATSLNNLAIFRSELGRREEALAGAEEAVALYRQLVETTPQAFVPDLAMSLSNLANRLSELGRREEALTVAEEAVALYRRLAEAANQAFVPNLATSLNNLASFLSELGRREEALAAAEEAVALRRRLAEAAPQAFVPNLAMSLNNLASFLSELGRREEALAAAEEAVGLYRQLVETTPQAFVPNLAMSLSNLANRLSELGRREEALVELRETTVTLDLPPEHAADLDARIASWHLSFGIADDALSCLDRVAAVGTEVVKDLRVLGVARRRARAVVEGIIQAGGPESVSDAALPQWMIVPVDPAVVDLASSWARIAGSADEAEFLAGSAGIIAEPSTVAGLAILANLYPGDVRLAHARGVVGAVADQGIDAVVSAIGEGNATVDAVRQWLAMLTWAEKREFFHARRQLLESAEAETLLSQDEPVLVQHLAILRLVADGVRDPFSLAADPDAASDALHEAVRSGRPERLALLAMVAPGLAAQPFQGGMLRSGAALAAGNLDVATAAAEAAAAVGTVDQRRGAAARFRQLATRRPDLAEGATELAQALDPTT